tara:strand:- start:4120 stop:4422 length:303 start_codon:yes stop_codon:yes gene_type:complete
MSRSDYNAIKEIIDDIVGDTHQGNVLLKAIKAYYTEKEEVRVVKYDKTIKSPKFSVFSKVNTELCKEADISMDKFTRKLAKENEKFRKKNGRASACSINS